MDKRILDLTTISSVSSDDYLVVDGSSGTRKITPENIVGNSVVAQRLEEHIADANNVIDGLQTNMGEAQSDIEELKNFVNVFVADVDESVQSWLDDHPEATTTVQDGAVTTAKLANGAVTIGKWSGDSSINNWDGNTLEEKLLDFLENANSGAKLDLQGAKITVTQQYTKSTYTFLNNTVISNGIIEIPSSIGGWLSIGSAGGYRVPIFNNCVFVCNDANSAGQIFNGNCFNFKAVGCVFHNVQITSSGYVQTCELVGCNIMNRNAYLIECNYAIGVNMTECSFEAGNVGVFKGNGDSSRESLTYGSFNNCIFEGFTDSVFRTHGITSVGFNNCYVEDVPYFIYDTNEYVNGFYVHIDGGRINNRASANDYTIYSNISSPSLIVNNLFYNRQGNQYLSNFENRRKQITYNNYIDTYLYGANNGQNEKIKTNHTLSGTSFSFSTNRTSMTNQPQAFLVIIAKYLKNTYLYTRVSILTLNYKASTGYVVTETPLVSNASMGDTTTWTASADSMLGLVTITGESDVSLYLSVVNLGATMSGMIV